MHTGAEGLRPPKGRFSLKEKPSAVKRFCDLPIFFAHKQASEGEPASQPAHLSLCMSVSMLVLALYFLHSISIDYNENGTFSITMGYNVFVCDSEGGRTTAIFDCREIERRHQNRVVSFLHHFDFRSP